jgi:hypothetical protein
VAATIEDVYRNTDAIIQAIGLLISTCENNQKLLESIFEAATREPESDGELTEALKRVYLAIEAQTAAIERLPERIARTVKDGII